MIPSPPYFIRTDYIYIKGSERIIFSGLTSNKYVSSIAYYDENKKYLSSIIAPVSGGGLYSGEIAASAYPEGAVYAIAVADQRYTETDFRYVPAPFFFVRYPVDKIQEEIDAVKNNVIGISEKLKVSQKTDSINQASFVQGNILTLEEIPDARNYYTIGLSLNITTMGKLSIYNEKTNIYSRGWLDIDAENITEHTASETLRTISHGLTLTDTLSVRIVVDVSTVTITVSNSEGQQFSTILGDWRARKGPNFNLENVEGIYSNVLFSFGGTWFRKPVLFFGDSYADYWPPRLYEKGIKNFAVDAYSGRNSTNAIVSFKRELLYSIPKKVVWMMGMNDIDPDDKANANWTDAYNELKTLCDQHGIALMLCTIPNTPTRLNSYKNEIVKTSGLPYIDMAAAVGATDSGSGWYAGLLGADNVHPTNEGAQVIMNAIAAGTPEICND